MFKLKNLYLFLSIIILSLSSCSKDDEETPTPAPPTIEGKWQITKEGEIVNNQEVLTNYQHATGCTKDYTEFLTGNVIKDHYFDNPNCQESIDTGTWSKNNNNLVLTYPGQPNINVEILELTSTTLKVKTVFAGTTYLVVFTRI